ncbi:MAG: hypothetical protein LC800_09610 [Acidobacteria bacterium]|nr:hypothetical protein [Acidobacteriota bacterium]
MGLLDFLRRKTVDTEAARRELLLKTGRIADGSIFDIGTDEAGEVTHVFYSYTFNGVDYESSQTLDAGQLRRAADYFPGAHCTVRFDPRHPANSVVV